MYYKFGRISSNSDEPFERILYSDWHCCVFVKGNVASIHCGPKVYELEYLPKCLTSNTRYLFLLSESGVLQYFSKSEYSICSIDLPKWRSISANDDELCCISVDGFLTIYSLTKFPTELEVSQHLSMRIKSVACGPGFALFLTPSGSVFSKGIGSRGQLGHGDLDSRGSAEVVEALEPVRVTAIACGSWHCACLTDTGDVYTWGSNEYGQLGCLSLNIQRSRNQNDPILSLDDAINLSALPIPVDFPDGSSIKYIACGSRHTACLSEDGELFTFGWNGYGQLGFESEKVTMPGRFLHETALDSIYRLKLPLSSDRETSLSCGSWCTIVNDV